MRGVIVGALSLAGLALGWNGTADAQIISNPEAVRACVCQQQSLATLLDEVHTRQQSYDNGQKELDALNSELEARRTKMDIYNDADVQAYKKLLQRRDDAATVFNGETTPGYNAAIARYNEVLAGYNGNCGGKSFDPDAYAKVQAALSCPKP
jgi:hypothetical protein